MNNKFVKIIILLTGILFILNGFSFLGEYYYLFELLTHFRLQYLVLFLLSSLFFAMVINKKWLLVSLFGLLINAASIVPIYLPIEAAAAGNNKVSLLLTNVLSTNQSYASLLNEIEIKQADFLVVLELTPQWLNALKPIEVNYPYKKLVPRMDNFGIALYSKHPLKNISVHDYGGNDVPSITAISQINKQTIHIIATHPIPPTNQLLAEQQEIHLANLAQEVRSKSDSNAKLGKPLILVAGDLNSTPWSPRYKKQVEYSGLINTRQGKGIFPSWPVGGILEAMLQIPLDHVLVSKNIHTKKIEKLDPMGSDHLPIYVELQF